MGVYLFRCETEQPSHQPGHQIYPMINALIQEWIVILSMGLGHGNQEFAGI